VGCRLRLGRRWLTPRLPPSAAACWFLLPLLFEMFFDVLLRDAEIRGNGWIALDRAYRLLLLVVAGSACGLDGRDSLRLRSRTPATRPGHSAARRRACMRRVADKHEHPQVLAVFEMHVLAGRPLMNLSHSAVDYLLRDAGLEQYLRQKHALADVRILRREVLGDGRWRRLLGALQLGKLGLKNLDPFEKKLNQPCKMAPLLSAGTVWADAALPKKARAVAKPMAKVLKRQHVRDVSIVIRSGILARAGAGIDPGRTPVRRSCSAPLFPGVMSRGVGVTERASGFMS
jgi:hypothetical protein